MDHLGKLEIRQARELLERIDHEEPGQLPVLIALYRCERYGGTPLRLDEATARVLGFSAKSEPDIRSLKGVCDDYLKACAGAPRIAPNVLLRLIALWLRIGEDAAAETLLRGVAERTPEFPGLPAAWFALALRAPESSSLRRARLEHVLSMYAKSDFAPKARFLLKEG